MGGGGRCAKSLLRSPCWPQSFLKIPKCFKMRVLSVDVLHHHNLKSQPLSVGIFFARSASVGAVPGHRLARGTSTTAPVPALFQPLSSLFSLFASRALSTPHPVSMGVCAVRVVNGIYYSLSGDEAVQTRRARARQSINDGRRLPQLSYLLEGVAPPSARRRQLDGLWEKLKDDREERLLPPEERLARQLQLQHAYVSYVGLVVMGENWGHCLHRSKN